MILMYSFFIISRFISESVFKKPSERLDRVSTLSNYTFQKIATSLLTEISSGNTQLRMSRTAEML